MPFELSREALMSETEGVLNAITHPTFVERMRRFRALTARGRSALASG